MLTQAGINYDRVRDLSGLLGCLPFIDERQADPDELFADNPARAINVTKWVIQDLHSEVASYSRKASELGNLWTYHRLLLLGRALSAEHLTLAWMYRQDALENKP